MEEGVCIEDINFAGELLRQCRVCIEDVCFDKLGF